MNRTELTSINREEGVGATQRRWAKRKLARTTRHAVRQAIRLGQDFDERSDLS